MSQSDIDTSSPPSPRQLLEQLLRLKAGNQKHQTALSQGQTSLFLDHLARPEGFAYNIAFSFKILSEIHMDALEQAFQLLVDRHEILRTTYGFENALPVQIIHGHCETRLSRIETAPDDPSRMRQRLILDARHPFDLFQGPVIRATLYSAGNDSHYFLLVMHHIAGDARTVFSLVTELITHYDRLQRGENRLAVDMPKSQYRDFIRWEQDLLKSPRGKLLKAFWAEELSGTLPALGLPNSPTSEMGNDLSSLTLSIPIDPALIDRAKRLAQDTGTGLSTLLFSAFTLLLHQYSGQDDLVVGMPTSTLVSLPSGKVYPDVAGYLVNPVVIRSRLTTGLMDYLKQLNTRLVRALDHQAYPFLRLQEDKKEEKNNPPEGLYSVMFNYITFSGSDPLEPLAAPVPMNRVIRQGALKLSAFPIPFQEGDMDLCMTLIRADGRYYASLSYDGGRYTERAVHQKLDDYIRVLEAMVERQSSHITDLFESCAVFGSPVLGELNAHGKEISREARFWGHRANKTADPLPFHRPSPESGINRRERLRISLGRERFETLGSLIENRVFPDQNHAQSTGTVLASLFFVLVGILCHCRNLRVAISGQWTRKNVSRKRQNTDSSSLPLYTSFRDDASLISFSRDVARELVLMTEYGNDFSPSGSGQMSEPAGLRACRVEGRLPDGRNPLGKFPILSEGNGTEVLGIVIPSDLGPTDFEVELTFDAALFGPERRETLSRCFISLLDQVLDDPGKAIGLLDPLSQRDMNVIHELSRSSSEAPDDERLIPELFRNQVRQRPHAVAILCGERQMTYTELDDYSEGIANGLYARGARETTRIGLCMNRSIETLAVLLGIFKSESVYVPIDPEFPEDRIAHMITDADIRILVTQENLLEKMRFKDHDLDILCPDHDRPGNLVPVLSGTKQAAGTRTDPTEETQEDTTAYIIYTSGSTGTPKGIPVSGKNLARHCLTAARIYRIGPSDRVLQFASLGFDVSLELFFTGLITGAALVLKDDTPWMPHECAEQMAKMAISVADVPPAYLEQLFRHWEDTPPGAPRSLRLLISGGDIMSPRVAGLWKKSLAGQTRLINAYGPTEATITALYYEVPADTPPSDADSVPLGRPLDGRWAYVLAPDCRPVLPGIPGELVLGGDGLAQGYLNRPDLTREKFIQSPFPDQAPGRLYRTGDRVRWRDDGNIEFLGRVDQQIKIRGFRIEPGEIESCLEAFPGIQEAAVLAVEGPDRNKRLKAFISAERLPDEKEDTGTDGGTDDEGGHKAVTAYLKTRLPDYMIPHDIAELDRLPRLPSGKLDRQALASLKTPDAPARIIPPADEVEVILKSIWARVLGLPAISMAADFFESGGHSLLAVQIISTVNRVFHLDLILPDLFLSPGLKPFAGTVKSRLKGEKRPGEPIRKQVGNTTAPLSFGQKRLWFLNAYESSNAVYNMPGAIHITGNLDAAVVKAAFDEIAQRHASLRTTFNTVDGQPVQIIHSLLPPDIEVMTLGGNDEADAILSREAGRPFDLEKGPLLRVLVLHVAGTSDHILFFNMHHIISDGWSIQILLTEFATVYKAFAKNAPSPLPELPIDYADYGIRQEKDFKEGHHQASLTFWKEQLRGLAPLLELPTDRPRPKEQTHNGAIEYFRLDEHLSDQVKQYANKQGVTLFMTLSTVFLMVLSRYTNREDQAVGFPIAGRQHPQTEDLIGFFVNTLVLRVRVQEHDTFKRLLGTVKQTSLDAFRHQDIPFEKLIDELGVERNIAYPPLVQVIFSMITVSFDHLNTLFDAVSVREIYNSTAKNDFTFFMMEEDHVLAGSVEYNRDLFQAETVRKTIADFKRLLKAAVTEPDWTLDRLLDACGIFGSPATPSLRDAADTVLTPSNLTRNQLLTYLGQKLKPESPHYNNPHLYEIHGHLDSRHFMAAVDTVLKSSDALQSRFIDSENIPVRIRCERFSSCHYLDLSHMEESRFKQWVKNQSQAVFDLAESLYTTFLIKRGDQAHVWFMNIHHIVIDGWSFNRVMLPLISECYQSRLKGLSMPPVSGTRFDRFRSWEKAYMTSGHYLQDKRFWDHRARTLPEPMTYYGNPSIKSSSLLDRISLCLGQTRTRHLKSLAGTEAWFTGNLNITLLHMFTVLMFLFLHKISGNSTLTIGIPFHNRKSGPTRRIIGLVMQTLPLTLTLTHEDTALTLFKKLSLELELMRQHSDFTLANPHDAPRYDVLVNFIVLEKPVLGDAHVKGGWLGPGHGYESLGFIITSDPSENDLEIGFDFHTDVFDSSLRKTAIAHFLNLLDGFLDNPEVTVGQANLLSRDEIHHLIHGVNDTDQPFPQDETVIQLFEKAAAAYPERIALVHRERTLTYRELNRAAEKIAYALFSRRPGPEHGVGILMERSIELVIAVLGVLKAGCFYVPMDPEYPEQRKRFIIEDASLETVLVNGYPEPLGEASPAAFLDMTELLETSPDGFCPANPAHPETTVYVTYTSGSTGMPKGVAVENRNLVNAYYAWDKAYRLSGTTAHLQMANATFDVFSGDLARALCTGAKLVICPRETVADPSELYRLMTREGIDFAEFVPVVLRLLFRYLKRMGKQLDFMKVICCGSDTWYIREYRDFLSLCGHETRLINSFGVTEATIDSSYFELNGEPLNGTSLVPMGKPFANNRLYVLDSITLLPVPRGTAGELFIGGAGVARGYLNRPELNRHHFIPDPFSGIPGATLFRTGDMARYLSGDIIGFLGRKDNQVKIRGFRIEPGEIESALSRHPGIRESLVMVREETPGQKQLAAYLVVDRRHRNDDAAITEIRSFLKDRLPSYMVPDRLILLNDFPLLPNGKIDRKSLPIPDPTLRSTRYAPPATRKEHLLARIWEEVLGIEKPGIHDNFFQLGGDSIISIQVVSRAKQQGLEVTVKQLFEFQTIHELAGIAGTGPLRETDQGPVSGPVPLTPVQQAFLGEAGFDLHHYNQSVLLSVPEPLDPSLLEKALAHLLAQHDALRLTFSLRDGIWTQEHTPLQTPAILLSTHPLSDLAMQSELLQKSLDLGTPPLVKTALFHDENGHCRRLLIIIHHLVVDGVSWRILLSDLNTAYGQLEAGREIRLPLKTTSFQHWSQQMSSHVRTWTHETGYWRELHDRARNTVSIVPHFHKDPGDPDGPFSNTQADARQVIIACDLRTTASLLQDIHHAYATRIHEILVSALVMAFSRTTGTCELFMDMEGHGRDDLLSGIDLSRTVGWFTCIYPVLLTPDSPDAATVITHVKACFRRPPNNGITYGYHHRGMSEHGFGSPAPSLEKPEILFNYLGQFDQGNSQPLPFKPVEAPRGQEQSPRQRRRHLLEINAHVSEGKLTVCFSYPGKVFQKNRVESLAGHFREAIDTLIDHCLDPDAGAFTPQDFPLIGDVSQRYIDDLSQTFVREKGITNLKRHIRDIYPPSPMQEWMLLNENHFTGGNVYLVQITAVLKGDLDIPRMKMAWESVLERHALLRSTFVNDQEGRWLQVVNTSASLPLMVNDLTGFQPEEQKTRCEQLAMEDRETGFDLSSAPLMRCTLNRLGPQTCHVILSNHHLLMDGWSTPLFFKELSLFYDALGSGDLPEFSDAGTYRQYIAWTDKQDKNAAAEFWKDYLKGVTTPTSLPYDRNVPLFSNRPCACVRCEQEIRLSESLSRDLLTFSRTNRLTVNTVLQGGYAAMLSRYCPQKDIVYGVTASVRPADIPGIESMIGLFINTLPVRVRISPDKPLIACLKDMMTDQAERDPYLWTPLTLILNITGRSLSDPLFESMFVFENYPVDHFTSSPDQGITVSHVRGTESNHYPLTLIASPGPEIVIKMSYDPLRFDERTIGQMLAVYKEILSGLPASP